MRKVKPTKSGPFPIRLDLNLKEWVEAKAEAAHTDRSDWIRQQLWRIHDEEKKDSKIENNS